MDELNESRTNAKNEDTEGYFILMDSDRQQEEIIIKIAVAEDILLVKIFGLLTELKKNKKKSFLQLLWASVYPQSDHLDLKGK